MRFVFQLMGCFFVALSVTKLLTIHYIEGTFLRQRLFLSLGLIDLMTAKVLYDYKDLPQSVFMGFIVLHVLEGSLFIFDGVFRSRPNKFAGKGRKAN